MKYSVNEQGYYGKFGGAYIPEMLYPNVEELRTRYWRSFTKKDSRKNSKSYSEIMWADQLHLTSKQLSEKYNTNIYLKREDLCHTGAHKVNNTIGQILLAKRLGKEKDHRGDRCWTTRSGHGYGMRADGDGMYRVHG
jgi:tryptophan synthase beta chain